jgi:hypothetical protein
MREELSAGEEGKRAGESLVDGSFAGGRIARCSGDLAASASVLEVCELAGCACARVCVCVRACVRERDSARAFLCALGCV